MTLKSIKSNKILLIYRSNNNGLINLHFENNLNRITFIESLKGSFIIITSFNLIYTNFNQD